MEILTVVPTYNEIGNIFNLINETLRLPLDIEVLIVDDFSPDGTYKVAKNLSEQNNKVHLLLRKEKRGRGYAGIDGFHKAIELGAKYIVEMDGDLSHHPKFIPDFINNMGDADIVIGSRYVRGGKDEARSMIRRVISFFARKYLSLILGIKVNDPTSGFRMFKRDALIKILPHLTAGDPFIVTEVLFYAGKYGMKIKEFPIEFLQRGTGKSKMKASMLLKYLIRVIGLRLGFMGL